MYLAGRWYALDLGAVEPEDDSRASSLDVALLQRNVLERILADRRRPQRQADRFRRRRARHAGARAGGRFRPGGGRVLHVSRSRVDDLMAISDAGGIMPPKSTWFEPKLRDGLLIHTI